MNDIALGKLTNDFEPSASVVCDIFEANPYTTRNQRLEICHKAMQGESVRTEPNNFMDMGNRLEKPIALAANDRIGLIDLQLEITEPVRHRHLCLNGSIDCIGVADNLFIKKDTDKGFYLPEKGEDEGIKINGKGIVEIKATNAQHLEAPPLYRGVLQVKTLMAITEYDWSVIAILNGTYLRMYFYERDFTWEKQELEPIITDFNKRVPHCDYYPPFDTKEASRIEPQDNGGTTELSKVAQTHIDNIETWQQQIKNLTENVEEAKKNLMMEMGKSQQGFSKSHQVIWKTYNYKAQPEKTKVIPAKESYKQRRLSIKKLPD